MGLYWSGSEAGLPLYTEPSEVKVWADAGGFPEQLPLPWAEYGALSEDGRAFCWGSHRRGQLGVADGTELQTCHDLLGDFPCSDVPVPVAGGLRFAEVDAGDDATCGIVEEDGAVRCWGAAIEELAGATCGNQNLPCNRSPAAVPGGRAFADVAVFGSSACGLTAGGEAFCWGFNRWGRLGAAGDGIVATPAASAPALRFTSLDLGADFACGITEADETFCWGSDATGQLGTEAVPECPVPEDGPCSAIPLPVAMDGAATAVAASAGNQAGRHACAVTAEGAVRCWGANDAGQLGLEEAPEMCESNARSGGEPIVLPCAPTPVPVAGPAFAAVEAGMWHNCGLTPDGRVLCWGAAIRGVLGTGRTLGRVLTPSPIVGPGL